MNIRNSCSKMLSVLNTTKESISTYLPSASSVNACVKGSLSLAICSYSFLSILCNTTTLGAAIATALDLKSEDAAHEFCGTNFADSIALLIAIKNGVTLLTAAVAVPVTALVHCTAKKQDSSILSPTSTDRFVDRFVATIWFATLVNAGLSVISDLFLKSTLRPSALPNSFNTGSSTCVSLLTSSALWASVPPIGTTVATAAKVVKECLNPPTGKSQRLCL